MNSTESNHEVIGHEESGNWGEISVTRRCCGAGNCRNFAPELFAEVTSTPRPGALPLLPGSYEDGAFSGVVRQPRSKDEYLAARTAAAGCGFGAIRLRKPSQKLPADAKQTPWQSWPRRLEDDVWVLGRPSTKNYGAVAYFIERPEGGILIDVPKPSDELFRWLEEHGGVRWLFLTHKDHAQHHAEIVERFPECRRVMGRADVNRHQHAYADATTAVEVQLPNDRGPMKLDGEPIAPEVMASEPVVLLPQPGHTPGSICLSYRGKFLFTGDHLAYSRLLGHIVGHRLQCWEDWERQTRSVEQLAAWADAGQLGFQWLLPGHGEQFRFAGDVAASELRRAVQWMREQPPGNVPLMRWIPFVMSRTKPEGRFARMVLGFGGAEKEAWVLPRASRRYVPDWKPETVSAAARKLSALLVATFALVGVAVWWLVRGV